jgi:hypothetical protein
VLIVRGLGWGKMTIMYRVLVRWGLDSFYILSCITSRYIVISNGADGKQAGEPTVGLEKYRTCSWFSTYLEINTIHS